MRSKDKMKGVILAGGLGSRLAPCTLVTNKHLLPVYDKPMIYYPLGTLIQAGITDILIVTGGQFAGDFLKLLGNGKEFGLKHLNYTYQEGEGGIADALSLAEYFVGDERVCVILGDNLIQGNIVQAVQEFEKQESGARVLLKEVEDPHRFGVAKLDGKKIVNIVEKPKNPVSNYAVTGIYFYDQQVFSMIKNLEPSARGELEITDVNNMYLDKNQLEYDILEGWWTDAGTFNSLHRASNLVAETGANLLKL
jgi:glucose-1-phosphate thymidylyltransferase